jgi:hypothetical protein
MGQLDSIVSDQSCDRFFHEYDVIGLLHTGITEGAQPDMNIASSHCCIYIKNRPLSPHAGGHAIYVKRSLKDYATVVLDRIEFGIV